MADLINHLEAIAGTVADRELFADALEASRFSGASPMITKYDQTGGNESTTQIDNSDYVEDALFELDHGQILTAGSFKDYTSRWDIEKYSKRIVLTSNDVDYLTSAKFNPTKMVDRANQRYVNFADRELVKTIKKMYGTGGNIYSRYDDVPTSNWFDTTHELGGTTFSNWNSAAPITAAGAIATNYTNFDDSVTAWEALPDTEGNEMGMNNRWSDNGLAIISPNLSATFRKLASSQSMSVTGDNVYYGNLNYVVLPGLANDTVVITRKPSDVIPGFRWAEAYTETLVPTRGNDGTTNYSWIYSVRMAMTGTIWMSSYLVK